MANDVEIRLRLNEDAKEVNRASYSSKLSSIDERSDRERSFQTQAERVADRRRQVVEQNSSIWERFESRLEYRMKRMGARMAGAMAAEEIGAALGVHNSFLGRMGQSAVEGGMVGGPQGAAIRMAMTLIHGVIDHVKQNHEEIRAMKQRFDELNLTEFRNRLDFLSEQNVQQQELKERLAELEDKFRKEYQDYVFNSARFINRQYLGAAG